VWGSYPHIQECRRLGAGPTGPGDSSIAVTPTPQPPPPPPPPPQPPTTALYGARDLDGNDDGNACGSLTARLTRTSGTLTAAVPPPPVAFISAATGAGRRRRQRRRGRQPNRRARDDTMRGLDAVDGAFSR